MSTESSIFRLTVQTQKRGEDIGGSELQGGIGLAVERPGAAPVRLRRGRGILFPRAVPSGTPGIARRVSAHDASIFRTRSGGIGVAAIQVPAEVADEDVDIHLVIFTSRTDDPASFEQHPALRLLQTDATVPRVCYDSALGQYLVSWSSGGQRYCKTIEDWSDSSAATASGDAAAEFGPLDLHDDEVRAFEARFCRPKVEAVDIVGALNDGPAEDASSARALIRYADGSIAHRRIDWDGYDQTSMADTDVREIKGRIRLQNHPTPFIADRADPTVVRWKNHWLFIATDELGDKGLDGPGLLLRSSDSISGLRGTTDHRILGAGAHGIEGCFYAPEFHELAGRLWCFFSASVDTTAWTGLQSFVMRLKTGGNPLVPSDWDEPRRVLTAKGQPLQVSPSLPGISLDMTVFSAKHRYYSAWSQRFITDVIGDAELWIAEVAADDPSRLISDPVRLAVPELAWEMDGANVVEAPFVTIRNGVVYMTYSGAAVGPNYAVGLVTAPVDADLLDPSTWSKLNYPILDSDPQRGEWGPGHSIFGVDEDGNDILVFHAKSSAAIGTRNAHIRRVHWAADGFPILDLTPEEEVPEVMRTVVLRRNVQTEASL